ncbi:MAG: flagellar biosynthetic protein FliO [Acidimicrobiia bacterium]
MNVSTGALVVRLVVSLGLVLGLMAVAAWAIRKRGTLSRITGQSNLEVLARQPLGRSSSMVVVRVGEKAIVLGVTEQHVSVLTEAEASAFAPKAATIDLDGGSYAGPGTARDAAGSGEEKTRTSFVDALREKTVRR